MREGLKDQLANGAESPESWNIRHLHFKDLLKHVFLKHIEKVELFMAKLAASDDIDDKYQWFEHHALDDEYEVHQQEESNQ